MLRPFCPQCSLDKKGSGVNIWSENIEGTVKMSVFPAM